MLNTRIAPSPTGDMHIGTARTAYFNYLAARASGGKFLLRIDDTDQKRNDPASTQVIFDIMGWLGLDYDRVEYQSKRFERYKQAIGEVPFREQDGAIVLDMTETLEVPLTWHDEVVGDVKITADDLLRANGTVLIRSDGSPTYNWASVIDDIDFGINYIMRGTDHITNTSKQVILFSLLRRPLPKFAHIGLIAQSGKLLSKRDGSSSMMHYKNAGYEPEAMLNFLARLGWGPKQDDKTTKTLPKERMLELFLTGGNLKSNQAAMDMAKLEALDRKYKAQKGVWRTAEKLM